jgi:glycosyltransferase involved in cell wall biosynthesis
MLERHFARSADAVVRNFHPLPREAKPCVEDGKFRVIWVANFKRDKNPELFVDLAEAFLGRRDIDFVMIGRPGGSRTYAALHARIARLRNLRFMGELPIETVNAELARSDVFVNTSSAEGFPNTFIQAWLRGVAVVSCYIDPDRCLTTDGAGILAGDPQGLFSVIGTLADDRVRTRSLGHAGREHALRHHGLQGAAALVDLLVSRDTETSDLLP